MPFCHQCGADNPETARFCDQCGVELLHTSAPLSSSGPAGPPVATGSQSCAQCGTQVIPGEAFCENCGAPLPAPVGTATGTPGAPSFGGVPPQVDYPPPQPVGVSSLTPPVQPPPAAQPMPAAPPPQPAPATTHTTLANVQVVVASTGAALALPAVPQAQIGRADAVSNFYPEIDLTPYGALEQGVGRRHMRLFVQHGQLFAEDSDSTNGTFLNGQKLAPRQPHPVQSGDELRLGRLVLKVRFV